MMFQKTFRFALYLILSLSLMTHSVTSLTYGQESAATENAAPSTTTETEGSPFGSLFYMLPLVALMIFMMFAMRPGQKDQAKRDEMLKQLKKNDRVVTAGGIVAKVSNVNTDQKTVKLLLDEKSGSSMTVTIEAISRVVKGDEKVDAQESA